jgi:hypothetical protein
MESVTDIEMAALKSKYVATSVDVDKEGFVSALVDLYRSIFFS